MLKLETPRLFLIPFSPGEGELFHQINTDPYVRKFLWDDTCISPETADEIVKQTQQYFQNDAWGLWKIQEKGTNQTLGYTGLWYFFEEPQPQLLYALLPSFTGQGFATEAAQRIITYVWEQLPFTYLIAGVDLPHQPSQQVCLRLGMRRGEERVIDGKATVFYRLDKPLL